MTAFTFRMGASFPGTVNRTFPASIEPNFVDPNYPISQYGLAVVPGAGTFGGATSTGTANTIRSVLATDTSITAIYGVLVRPYPISDLGTSSAYGVVNYGVTTVAAGANDVMRSGYIMVPVNGNVIKGGQAYLWVAASTGNHILGGFEAAAGANIVALANAYYNGPADSNGYAELTIRLA